LHVLMLGGGLSPRLEIRGVLIFGKRHIHDADSNARFCAMAASACGLPTSRTAPSTVSKSDTSNPLINPC
jgi:hypothetical protein